MVDSRANNSERAAKVLGHDETYYDHMKRPNSNHPDKRSKLQFHYTDI